MRKALSVLLFYGFAAVLSAQTQDVDALVRARVKMLDQGKADQVKAELPSLVAKYQNHPGILYLQGRLSSNGAEASRYYQSVVDNFPKSEWADDALYRIYLYYSTLGLSRTANLKMQQLRKDYPNSPHLREKPYQAEVSDSTDTTAVVTPPVVVSEPPPEPVRKEVTPSMPAPESSGNYAIQVGAFSSLENATRLKSYFEELGYPVDVQNRVRGGRSLHLVWAGRFASADEARRFGAEVKRKHNIESIVISRY